ncbi:phosphoglycerate dehydrogenase-like enzyme [Bacillus ectoiniformans]|uniref:NAD(P)-dependent oxidoreductase n=1 Tax=Bacillus ectoiniformans TaxID=1494429 RepID=UPI00195A9F1C|nr:phosphoglycerate dehydrogenase-like enzyme [Bacillus ectoiniformans]
MKVVSTFRPSRELQAQMKEKFSSAEFLFYPSIKEAEMLEEAEVLVTFGEDLTDEYIDKCQNLKWIMVASAGLERMPFKSIKKRQIIVTNARGIHKIPMAEFTMGYMLNHVKRFPELLKLQQEKMWNKKLPLQELSGKELLVLGTGAIGSEIARLAKAFRMNTAGVNRSGGSAEHFDRIFKQDDILTALPQADFVVSVLPSTKETKYFIQKSHFEAMKQEAAFINIGRGDLFEEQILLEALNDNQIAHAYLDVFMEEPLPKDHAYWHQDRLTVTPHISSISKMYLPRAFEIFEYNLEKYLQSDLDLQNLIDVEKGY